MGKETKADPYFRSPQVHGGDAIACKKLLCAEWNTGLLCLFKPLHKLNFLKNFVKELQFWWQKCTGISCTNLRINILKCSDNSKSSLFEKQEPFHWEMWEESGSFWESHGISSLKCCVLQLSPCLFQSRITLKMLHLSSVLRNKQKTPRFFNSFNSSFRKCWIFTLMCNANFKAVGLRRAIELVPALCHGWISAATRARAGVWEAAAVSMSVCLSVCRQAFLRASRQQNRATSEYGKSRWKLLSGSSEFEFNGFPLQCWEGFVPAPCLAIWPGIYFHSVRINVSSFKITLDIYRGMLLFKLCLLFEYFSFFFF